MAATKSERGKGVLAKQTSAGPQCWRSTGRVAPTAFGVVGFELCFAVPCRAFLASGADVWGR